MTDSTPLYGLIGRTLSHSFSKQYFTDKFAREQIQARYELFAMPDIQSLPLLLQEQPSLRGLNVTIPYKREVIPYLDVLSADAEAVGAVNTIAIGPDGLKGYNTDIHGFEESLRELLGGQSIDRALVLGTGGAALAVVHVLNEWEIDYRLVSRTPKESHEIGYPDVFDFDLTLFPLIVNCTPLGMQPDYHTAPDIPYEDLGKGHFIYDLVYNPAETKFMRLAAARGAKTCNGLRMLELQAEWAWKIWQGEEKVV
jgi:shikimate dehydrogenase